MRASPADGARHTRHARAARRRDAAARTRAPGGRGLAITQSSPAARVALRSPPVERLREVGSLAVEPKQAWTNVADFAARGLDAVNFGPGATRYAHAQDERVEISELERTFTALQRFLLGSV